MENLVNFIQKYSFEEIKVVEHHDPQFLALKKCWHEIDKKDKNLFLFVVIQCALVSYQIAGKGELWWTECGQKFLKDWDLLVDYWDKNESNNLWRYNFLTTSKYNKRIYNIKTQRLKKFDKILQNDRDFLQYQNDMQKLLDILSKFMKCKNNTKTVVFAIKMFGYACEIITGIETKYPMNIDIPLDSRLKKIFYLNNTNILDINRTNILKYFQDLSKKYNIPPLHLDSILRLEYRKTLN